MIRRNNLSLTTWLQAILVANLANEDIDIGYACVTAGKNPSPQQQRSNLFGDDTKARSSVRPGWNVRGENGELKEGSVLTIRVTRPIALDAIFETKKRHKNLGAYIKALIRKMLKNNPSDADRVPNKAEAIDVFSICEGKIRKRPSENPQRKDVLPKPKHPKQRKHTPCQEQHQNDTSSNTCIQSQPRREDEQDKLQQKPADNKVKQQEKKRNPLLNYI